MRIELAKLLLQNHDVLLLDEPTNHLDIDSILWLEDFLATYTGAVVLVSHDKQFLDNITNRTIEIANKKIEDYKANYSKYITLRTERREKLVQSQKNQEKEIKHTQDLISKFRAKANKASMAQSLIKKLDKVERIEIDNEDVTKMNIRFASSVVPGKVVFELEKVSKAYDKKMIISGVDMLLERGAKVAFVGQNGQGKTTLARMMVGDLPLTSGKIQLGHNVQVGYFAQNQAAVLDPNKTVQQEAEHSATEETFKKVRDLLGSFMFSGETVEKKTSVLSGGERNRLALCKLLLRPFNVLVMDEPTNHLDIQSKEILKQALLNFDGTLVLVSHDREFLDGLVDKVYDFRDGKVKEFLGGIGEYLQEKKAMSFREVEKTTESSKVSAPVKSEQNSEKQNPSNQDSNQKERVKIEKKVETLEAEIKALEALFLSENPDQQKLDKYSKLKAELDDLLEKWASLS
ncbi:MAG: glycosyl transferase family 2 [Flavobacteriaceae bacterium]|nr:MAG: glycosyl transferase family 2 [Flavobacteriaceae bacterium]